MTVQAAHGQLLVDMLNELRSLQVDLESFRRSPLPPPFDDEYDYPLAILHKKREYICRGVFVVRGRFCCVGALELLDRI